MASILVHATLFAALWWALTGGAPGSWVVGVPVVLAATAASRRLWPRDTGWWSPSATVRFVAFFLRESIRGGLDVARRAFDPALPLQPALLELRSRLPPGPAEALLANVVSLLPGTLSADLNGRTIVLHVLDDRAPVEADLRVLEGYIAAMFRVPLIEEDAVP